MGSSVIKYTFFDLLMINLEFGKGLFGPSPPLIFKIQATFSGAVTNKQSALFFFRWFTILLIFDLLLSPTISSLSEKKGKLFEFFLSFYFIN